MSGEVTAGNLAVGASTATINVNYVDFIIANNSDYHFFILCTFAHAFVRIEGL